MNSFIWDATLALIQLITNNNDHSLLGVHSGTRNTGKTGHRFAFYIKPSSGDHFGISVRFSRPQNTC